MILKQIKQYCKEKRKVSLSQLCLKFQCQAKLVAPMLELLVRKGYLQYQKPKSKCSNCPMQCANQYFIWIQAETN